MRKTLHLDVEAKCAVSGRELRFSLDGDLNISRVTEGAEPMVCFPIVQLVSTKQPSIVDVF